jgi:5,5'-dehydrodivanillate O-demethylase oxygenase subunit
MLPTRHDLAATGPGTLAGRYLRMFWQPIAVADELAPGRAKPLRVLGEDFTLYRGESGATYLVAFRCLHRGTQLSSGKIEGEYIRCRYHGWKYAGDGRCLEQPAELDRQFCDKVRLGSRPTRTYNGLVFAYFGEGTPPEFPTFPHLEGDGIIETSHYRRQCNFFNSIDNQFDESHVNFTHPYQFRRIPELPTITYERTAFGAMLYSARPGKGVRARQFLMPNVLRLKVPSSDDPEVYWTDYVNWRVPVDDTAHYTFGLRYIDIRGAAKQRYLARRAALRSLPVPPLEELTERILRGDATLEEVEDELGDIDLSYKINLEDNVTQVGQGIVADRDAECLGSADAGVRLLRQLWIEALDQVAAGERPAAFTTFPDIEITSGDVADFAVARE